MKSDSPSSQKRSHNNAERLSKWLKETPLDQVPINQFGQASRKTICAKLSIPRSTVGTGKGISQFFEDLDKKLLAHSKSKKLKHATNESLTTVLSDECHRLEDELSNALNSSRRLEYLESTGFYLGQNRV
jgi:hypothetical protein